jgi:hypothetical protein
MPDNPSRQANPVLFHPRMPIPKAFCFLLSFGELAGTMEINKWKIGTLALLLGLVMLWSQGKTQLSNAYLNVRAGEFKEWLHATSLDTLLAYQSFDTTLGHYTFHLSPANCKVGGKSWEKFSHTFRRTQGSFLEEVLLRKVAFLLEVDLKLVHLHIQPAYATCRPIDYWVTWRDDGLTILNSTIKSMGQDDEPISASQIPKIYLGDGDTITDQTLDKVRDAIGNQLKAYYAGKGTFWLSAKIDPTIGTGELTYEITNISNEILDVGYFERIIIEVKLMKTGSKRLNIRYNVQGKYASGLIWAPRNSEYKDMETKYPYELAKYTKKLVAVIKSAFE